MTTKQTVSPYVKAIVRRAFVQIIGRIWMPPVTCAQYKNLTDYDLGNIGEFTRENVEQWLTTNSGDFQSVEDFRAVCGSEVIDWAKEESEITYCDCTPE